MTNLKKCLVCGRVFRFSDRHVCFDVAPSPASPWDATGKPFNKKRGTRNRPHRPTVFLCPPPAALTPQQGASRRRCIYCRRTGADVEIRTKLATGPGLIVVFRHSQCRPPAPTEPEIPAIVTLPTSVQCVECGAELLDGSHVQGCPFHPGAATMPPEEGGPDA